MKKKLITAAVALMMAMIALPCFAEIRVDRGGATEGLVGCNAVIYWNDKYDDNPGPSAKEQSMYAARTASRLGELHLVTAHLYISHGVCYKVIYLQTLYNFRITVSCQYENGYDENLYSNVFYSSNEAKAKFDSLCQQYYNKIPK